MQPVIQASSKQKTQKFFNSKYQKHRQISHKYSIKSYSVLSKPYSF